MAERRSKKRIPFTSRRTDNELTYVFQRLIPLFLCFDPVNRNLAVSAIDLDPDTLSVRL